MAQRFLDEETAGIQVAEVIMSANPGELRSGQAIHLL